jgi:hypothetical protein
MKTYSPFLQRNRSAHLRDRDIFLRALQTNLDYMVANISDLMKSGTENGNLQDHLQELEKNNRKALHHAEVAFRYCKQIDADEEKYPELQEIFLIDLLQTIQAMCGCAIRHLTQCEQISHLFNDHQGPNADSVREFVSKTVTSTEEMVGRFISDMQARMQLYNKFLSALE